MSASLYNKKRNFFFKNVFFSSFPSVDKYLTTATRRDALSSVRSISYYCNKERCMVFSMFPSCLVLPSSLILLNFINARNFQIFYSSFYIFQFLCDLLHFIFLGHAETSVQKTQWNTLGRTPRNCTEGKQPTFLYSLVSVTIKSSPHTTIQLNQSSKTIFLMLLKLN